MSVRHGQACHLQRRSSACRSSRYRQQQRGAVTAKMSVTNGMICADLMEARYQTAAMSCFLLTWSSTDQPIWGCRSDCYTSAPACSEARVLQLRAIAGLLPARAIAYSKALTRPDESGCAGEGKD